ncbi:YbaB/EbfC family nucleoid-associated protein [Mycoplasma zalophidermidis]|uniref:YbaB/EbfC family nucleoid-associated protein n=1 Tax=Mycoplasma zalophidermidis TaxID=398174 RepID=A0ABS6DR43_9MOLU|nr:YbaB/EbfC family nucleoid-associated protein [Mycoplasma zalophidermidis]MBU4689481.1 YbaB/EbfC family nucleoid-associated protein [Mycoplasma zalophidermidis]MBU4693359.1 YbaB/EbfC family nucleoid-associated protein [Mycoplasma zalophidermidis]MCR8966343.1 YbaB/EbfC family nucleoid-associated protein [Mycoplasma zalophidermidis]
MDQGMLRKMQKLQKELEQKTEEFMELTFSEEKYGLEVIATGAKKIVSIKIKDQDLLDPEDAQTLEDLMTLVINQLFTKIDDEQEKLMPHMPNGFSF